MLRHKWEITVSGLIGSPASLRNRSPAVFCWYASKWQHHLLRVQRDQSSCFQKSKLEGIGWEPLIIVSKWQRALGPCATNGVISTWSCSASDKKPLRIPRHHSWYAYLQLHLPSTACTEAPVGWGLGTASPSKGSKGAGRLGRLQF